MKENNNVHPTLYITVLDFEEGRVYQYESPSYLIGDPWEQNENFITKMGHNLTNCEWMEHSNPIVITK